jgi:prolyl oligopeptidase
MPAPDPRPTLEAPDDDPHLWLEEIESAPVLDWVVAQNSKTLERFRDEGVAVDHKILKAIFDRPGNIPVPDRRAGKLFNPWRDAANPRGVWRTTTLESFRSDAPNWDVLIDVEALAATEDEDWVWRDGDTLPPMHDRAVVQLSRGGADAVVLREFDLSTRNFVPNGFSVPESKSSSAWVDRDTLLLSSPLGADTCGNGGAIRCAAWRRSSNTSLTQRSTHSWSNAMMCPSAIFKVGTLMRKSIILAAISRLDRAASTSSSASRNC